MPKFLASFALVSSILLLVGCGGSGSAVSDPGEDYRPELRAFDIIDSYDTDTAKPNHPPLALSPYFYDGLFEVFWSVNSLEDYTVSLRINDRASIANSILISSQVCGAGFACDQGGGWICEYTNDFFMSCDTSSREVDIYPLIDQLPQRVFLLLEVCDRNSGYCEYDYYPVTLE
uniref:hypothetical protein n=1 Tax=Cellvibrio fontiphilus TaxID=1815559 RepID=UPI002B4BA523|nr:hypothetical protein [Cellvibrio fontiphilus]